ncbi:MAG: hypothetical protein J0H68_07035 [Sphingobacteriia bacterium]|nr:hypothetical protein [Sphingobacteriia bacterium]
MQNNLLKKLIWPVILLLFILASQLEPAKLSLKQNEVDLTSHESGEYAGHTLKKHVDKKEDYLINRLKNEPNIKAASTFYDNKTAERAIKEVLDYHKEGIKYWLESANLANVKKFELDIEENVGFGIKREDFENNNMMFKHSSHVIVVLRKVSDINYKILTAYVLVD